MAALPPLWLCILDYNFIIQVKLVAASRSIFGPMFSVLHTLNFFARVIWVRHGTELQLGYLQLAMLFTASKNEVEPIIEKQQTGVPVESRCPLHEFPRACLHHISI